MSDEFVEEIHAIRRSLAEECGNDMHRIAEYFRRLEAEHPERLIYEVPKTEPEPRAAANQ
ncbi:MAG: hypothetical protein ABSG53_32700 [Thermoguttaceae bacterium]